MSTLRNLSLGLSLGLHLAAIGGLVFLVRPDSGAKFAAPPTIELMLPPMAVAAASSVAPVDATEVTPVEAAEVTPPEPEVVETPPDVLPVMTEAVQAVEPVVAVAAEQKPEPPKPEKPKPRERAERPKKPAPQKEKVEAPAPAAETVTTAAPPRAVAAVAAAGTAAVAGGGNPGAKADFKALVSAWIERHKRFPDRLRRRGLQGTPVVRFRLTRDGQVVDCRIERGSPHDGIDEAAMETIRRAEPFPAMPDDVPGETMEFTVPIAFNLR
ncbi:energy transducer TonB [Zavarzinia aquatilis]|uniref:TonB C-terminal domain-containing protein n=1 Tax=Zavarzinia aquatilis TaxID=2211142 RepID=A0A317E2A8_9PROT|nr:energy transducer TonB [Zavarzinia aquatilis]PWR20290.1 hypothetical protein DKG74_14870 [Zavarzinia aquatilis]